MAVRRAERSLWPDRPWSAPVVPAVLLVAAVLLGGGGSPAVSTELLLQFISLLLIAFVIFTGTKPFALWRQDRRWAVLVAAVIAFPLLQLLPLPPALWSALPGRDAAIAALAASGDGGQWRAWSLFPDNGVTAALALVPAVVMAVLTAGLPIHGRVRLITLMAALAAVTALIGIVQFIRGFEHPLSFYADIHRGWGIGFFANRNAQANSTAIGPSISTESVQ